MASTSGTNTVRDNSILPQCNALYLSFNGLLSQPPPLHWKKSFHWFITKYPADKLILPHLTFQAIFNFRMINLTSAIAQDIWQQRWKFKNTSHLLTKKTAPFVPPIHSYSIKLPKPILSAIPTKNSDISNVLWTGTLATKTQTTCWLSSTLEWRSSPMNGSNMFCSRNSVSNNVDDVDNDDGGEDDDGDGYPQMIPWVLLKRSSRKYWEKVN